MQLLPHFPLQLNPMIVFGLTLLLGLIGGELAKRLRFFPIISGYILMGFLVGPGGFNIVNASVLSAAHIFVEISISLILFELARHLDFRWLARDRGLLLTAITEAMLTFSVIFFAMHYFVKLSWLQSALAGTIAMTTSAAVVMMIAYDLSAEGPVTRRTLLLTSTNNLIALFIFTVLLPMSQPGDATIFSKFVHACYQLFGSIFLGLLMFVVTLLMAYLIKKSKENQFILFVSMVVLTTSLGQLFNLSTMVALFTLGLAARNFDYKHIIMEVDFGWLARLFIILMFVVAGLHLQLKGLSQSMIAIAILIFIFARLIAKFFSVWLFSGLSNVTRKQSLLISLALSPMAGVAIGMSHMFADFNPDFGHQLLLIISGVVAVLNIVAPIITQIALIKAGETLSNEQGGAR